MRLPTSLLDRVERYRAAAAERAGVEVDLRAACEALLLAGLDAAEQRAA